MSCLALIKTKDNLQADLNDANEKAFELGNKVEGLEKEVKELGIFSSKQLDEGFKLAREQYTCVYLDLDHSQFSVVNISF